MKQEFALTPHQQEAYKRLIEFIRSDKRITSLLGCAGSGKSFVTAKFMEYIRSAKLKSTIIAPTHNACRVFAEKGINAVTIHKYFDSHIQYDENGKEYFDIECKDKNIGTIIDPDKVTKLLIVDECSMVGEDQYNAIVNVEGAKVIFVGDPYQLPPVGEERSKTLEHDKIELSEIVRTKNDKIRQYYDRYRQGVIDECKVSALEKKITHAYCNRNDKRQILLERYKDYVDKDNIVITYTKNMADEYNKLIRKLYVDSDDKFAVGDRIVFDKPVYVLNRAEDCHNNRCNSRHDCNRCYRHTDCCFCDDVSCKTSPIYDKCDVCDRCSACSHVYTTNYYKYTKGLRSNIEAITIEEKMIGNRMCKFYVIFLDIADEYKDHINESNKDHWNYTVIMPHEDCEEYVKKFIIDEKRNYIEHVKTSLDEKIIQAQWYVEENMPVWQDELDYLNNLDMTMDNKLIKVDLSRYYSSIRILPRISKIIKPWISSRKKVLQRRISDGFNKSSFRTNMWRQFQLFTSYYLSGIKHAYSVNVHKSQGSTYDNVFVDEYNCYIGWDKNNDPIKYNSMYTAVTRSSNDFFLF